MATGLWVAAVVAAVVVIATPLVFRWLYVKVPPNMAFVRTGLGGRKVVTDAGAFVLPIVHNVQWLSLETFKIEIVRRDRDAFITKDRYRVDIGAEFYLKIVAEDEMLEAASRSLGEKSFSADDVRALVEEKLVSALRSAAAQRELVQLHEDRRGFALAVRDLVLEPLAQNGLGVEDVAIFALDQTDRSQLDPNNIFDAEGLRQITAQTSARMQERNEIERNTEVAIKRKDVEAVKLKLELEREQEFAQIEQTREIENHRVATESERERFRYERERETREAEIESSRYVREVEIRQAIELLEREREQRLAEIEKERQIEEAQRAMAIAVLQAERKRLEEERQRLAAEAEREAADQAVVAVRQRAEAERAREIAGIEAERELAVAQLRAQATERLAEARRKQGEAEARVAEQMRRAENAIEPKLVYRDVALQLVERLPELARELMEPARHIDSIRVLRLDGMGGESGAAPGGDGKADPLRRIFEAVLGTGAALPLLRELLDFARRSGLLERLEQELPAGLARRERKEAEAPEA